MAVITPPCCAHLLEGCVCIVKQVMGFIVCMVSLVFYFIFIHHFFPFNYIILKKIIMYTKWYIDTTDQGMYLQCVHKNIYILYFVVSMFFLTPTSWYLILILKNNHIQPFILLVHYTRFCVSYLVSRWPNLHTQFLL